MNANAESVLLPGADGPPALLMWDGRLDNREDLCRGLSDPPGGVSEDRWVVLATFERWGIAGLGHVIGDWSAVIHDRRHQAIVLASDYAGVRPLYYRTTNGIVRWSSRLEDLVQRGDADTLDESYILAFLTSAGRADRTPYAEIRLVPPGHAVSISASGETIQSFWSPPTGELIRYRDERSYDEQLRVLFREAVAVRLQTKSPVVAELSGGLDSSSVVCMASELIRRREVTARRLATVSYLQRDSSDAPFIREVEQSCDINGIHLSIDRDPLITETAVGPIPQPGAPVHRSAALVARRLGAKVFLTGQNGDLVMGNWYDDSLQVAGALRKGHLGRACQEALAWSKVLRVPAAWILWRAARAAFSSGRRSSALYSLQGLSEPQLAETSLRLDFVKRHSLSHRQSSSSADWFKAPAERRKHFLALSIMREQRTLQSPHALQDFDYTHPFAHRPLVEFMMSIPPAVLCRPGEPRRLMRRALADLWPAKLRGRRSKSLFTTPWAEALKPLAARLLATPDWHVVSQGWIDRASLTARLKRLIQGLDCNETQLRQVLLLEFWLRSRHQRQPADVVRQSA